MKLKFIPLLLISACMSTQEDPDPHRCFNEAMLDVNLSLDDHVLKPVSHIYEGVTNEPVRMMVSNFLDNLNEPFYLVNYTLQIDGENISSSFFRFLINSTVGFFGFFDIAELMGVPKHSTGYKETLHQMEVPHGDYIVLPVLGFSSTRDTIAEPVSWFANPVSYVIGWPWTVSKAALQMVVDRQENSKMIDSMKAEPEDLYAKTRSIYLQKYGNGEGDSSDDEDPSFDD